MLLELSLIELLEFAVLSVSSIAAAVSSLSLSDTSSYVLLLSLLLDAKTANEMCGNGLIGV